MKTVTFKDFKAMASKTELISAYYGTTEKVIEYKCRYYRGWNMLKAWKHFR